MNFDGQQKGVSETRREMEIEQSIDDALAQFAKAEPRPGLDARVLARLRAAQEEPARKLWWEFQWEFQWRTAAAFGAVAFSAAAILAVVLLWRGRSDPTHLPETPVANVNVLPQTQKHDAGRKPPLDASTKPQFDRNRAVVVALSKSNRGIRTVAMQQGAPPKLDQFPAPQPLSEQEQILMSYVARYPETALIAQARPEASLEDLDEDAAEAAKDDTE